jgi:archaellum component FlaC
MTPEQLKEMKETIVGVATVLDEKLDAINFKLDEIHRAIQDADSSTTEVGDQTDEILEKVEEIKEWCLAIRKQQGNWPPEKSD